MNGKQDEYQRALALSRASPPDLKKAYKLLLAAKEQNDPRAIYAISTWYGYGNDIIEKDEKMRINLLKQIKESFVAEAIFDLAVAYDYGNQVRRDERRAFNLYMMAAILGDREASSQVSQFYAEGKIVEYSRELAKAWKKRSEQDERDISPPYRIWIDEPLND